MLQVDELERQLRLATKDVQVAEDELDNMRNKCALAEIETMNHKTESDTLRSKIFCMEHEMESLKSMCKEMEILQIEKNRYFITKRLFTLDSFMHRQPNPRNFSHHLCLMM